MHMVTDCAKVAFQEPEWGGNHMLKEWMMNGWINLNPLTIKITYLHQNILEILQFLSAYTHLHWIVSTGDIKRTIRYPNCKVILCFPFHAYKVINIFLWYLGALVLGISVDTKICEYSHSLYKMAPYLHRTYAYLPVYFKSSLGYL